MPHKRNCSAIKLKKALRDARIFPELSMVQIAAKYNIPLRHLQLHLSPRVRIQRKARKCISHSKSKIISPSIMNAILEYCNPKNKLSAAGIAQKFNISYNLLLKRLKSYQSDEIIRKAFKLKKCFVELEKIDMLEEKSNESDVADEIESQAEDIEYIRPDMIDDDEDFSVDQVIKKKSTILELEFISEVDNAFVLCRKLPNEEDQHQTYENDLIQNEFSVGDIVFAKHKNTIPMPAEILSKNKRGYFVAFFGSGNYGNINGTNIWPYEDFSKGFITAKNLKNINFKNAIECAAQHLTDKNL